jgi:alpha-D-ribose 1-methylphosphonate 5-triphosphate synthase subunit PhnH
MAAALESLTAAFADPVHDSQQVFRTLLTALAEPGRALALPRRVESAAEVGLCPALAAMVLTLADVDTPLHWPQLAPAGAAWLRFHVGAPLAEAAGAAVFVIAFDAPPRMAALAAGSDEAPAGSATLLLRLARLDGGTPMRWRGPGIDGARTVALPLPAGFWDDWSAQHARFPIGVDVIATDGERVLGLPRSTAVQAA